MSDEILKLTRNWADREKEAVILAVKKLQEIGVLDKELKEVPKKGYSSEKIILIFKSYLNHYSRMHHKYDHRPLRIHDFPSYIHSKK
jgi:hypothetical protein